MTEKQENNEIKMPAKVDEEITNPSEPYEYFQKELEEYMNEYETYLNETSGLKPATISLRGFICIVLSTPKGI